MKVLHQGNFLFHTIAEFMKIPTFRIIQSKPSSFEFKSKFETVELLTNQNNVHTNNQKFITTRDEKFSQEEVYKFCTRFTQ
jgi:hypothetical protein